jgi:hypothetical protein
VPIFLVVARRLVVPQSPAVAIAVPSSPAAPITVPLGWSIPVEVAVALSVALPLSGPAWCSPPCWWGPHPA